MLQTNQNENYYCSSLEKTGSQIISSKLLYLHRHDERQVECVAMLLFDLQPSEEFLMKSRGFDNNSNRQFLELLNDMCLSFFCFTRGKGTHASIVSIFWQHSKSRRQSIQKVGLTMWTGNPHPKQHDHNIITFRYLLGSESKTQSSNQ